MQTKPHFEPIDGQRDEPHDPQDMRRDLTVRSITLRAESVNEDNRSVEAVIATEDPVTVFDLRAWEPIDEVLRMDGAELPDQVPLLANHNRFELDAVYGSARELQIEGTDTRGRLYFTEGDADADRAWNKVRQRHLRDVSAGYRVIEATDIQPGETAIVKGRSYTAGVLRLRIATRWALREVSLVPIGADQRSKIRRETNPPPRQESPTVNPRLKAELIKRGLRSDASDADAQTYYAGLAAETRAAVDAAVAAPAPTNERHDPAPAPSNPPADSAAIRAEAVRLERDRVRQIAELAGDDVPADIRQRAIDEGWTVDQSSRAFLDAVRTSRSTPDGERRAGPAIHSHSRESDVTARSLAAGLLIGQGLDPVGTRETPGYRMHDGRRHTDAFTEQDADQGHRLQRLSAIDICRACVLIDSGRQVWDYEEAVRSAVSGATFSHVFSTNVYARLIEGWMRTPDTTGGWCDEEDVANFTQQEDISIEANARLQRLPRGDRAKHATASDKHETYKIARFAKQFVADEQDFLDDRLGAIMRMPFELGEAARQLRPDLVYSLMLANPTLTADGGPVFNSTAVTTAGGHANLTTAVLGSTGLKAAITSMVKQRINRSAANPGHTVSNTRPRYLIVPAALEWTARELTSAAALTNLFTDSSDPVFAALNLLMSEGLRVVIDDRVGAIGVLDPTTETVRTGLDTNWFLTAGGSKGLRVAYRRGTGRQPQMRSFTLDRGQWGMGWDINLDIGATFLDYRPWHKSTGAG